MSRAVRSTGPAGALAVGAVAAAAARAAYAGLRRRPPAGQQTWTRTNHRGEPLTLLEGPAAAVGAITAELIGAAVAAQTGAAGKNHCPERSRGSRPALAMALAGGGALAFGLIDDLAGSGQRRGLRGHLGALAHGEVTTGTVKLGGLAATGLAAAVPGSAADTMINAGLIAGGANLLNLFDLRPGRAIKVTALSAGLIAAGSGVLNSGGDDPPHTPWAGLAAVAAPLGASLALLSEDLGERAMLGDAGANALGAMLGAAAARSLPRPARIGLLAGIIALTVASEKVSFTAFIERTPALRRLDMLGRKPVPLGAPVPAPRRPRTGRHRRVGSGDGRVRSGERFLPVIRDLAEPGSARRQGSGIGRAAVLIGVITVLARLVGFGRQVVFAHTVGTTCLGTAYTTANMVPNIIYDVVLGGALSSVVVPVLAGPAVALAAGETSAQARRIASALLTWTVLLLVPVSAAVALAAHPIVSVLLSGAAGCARAGLAGSAEAGVGARMLIVFAPQVLLYGLAVVLYGILQSHRRFGAPALAPLLSSLVVIGAYAGFGAVGGDYVNRLRALPPAAEYLLSGGTTLGVLALVVTAVVPAWRLHVATRPTLRFPPGIGSRVRRLAVAGVVTLVAQDASVAVVIVLANRYGSPGALVMYGFVWAVFVVPYAVLAVPIATSAFPELSAGAGRAAEAGGFDVTSAVSTRAVMVASWLGAATLVGARVPLARVFESHNAAAASVLALALVAFAPGLVGYGLSANLSRVLYARGRNRATATAVAAAWLVVIVADLLIVPIAPRDRVVPALGLGTTVGLTVSGIALLILVRRERGPGALRGVSRAFGAGLAGCAAAAAAGWAVAAALPVAGFLLNVAASVLVTVVVAGVFTGVVLRLDGGDLRAALARLRARAS